MKFHRSKDGSETSKNVEAGWAAPFTFATADRECEIWIWYPAVGLGAVDWSMNLFKIVNVLQY